MNNPYLDEFNERYGDKQPPWYQALSAGPREDLVTQYAWAVPTTEALELMATHSPIIEMGAGTGYWASLLQEMGVDIVAYDIAPPGGTESNEYRHKKAYVEVLLGSHEKLREHPDHTLFLCWPPYQSSMAHDCLKAFKGGTLLFVGESNYGCTGGEDFWDLIHGQWSLEDDINLPQHPGLHDTLKVFVRKDKP